MTGVSSHLLNLVWHRRVHQSEQQIPQGSGLSTQDARGHAPGQRQSQMIGQKTETQLEEIVVFPENKKM